MGGTYSPLEVTAGTTLHFRFSTEHDVTQLMTSSDFENCFAGARTKQLVTGFVANGEYFHTLTPDVVKDADENGQLYFVCSARPFGDYTHCDAGQKIIVRIVESTETK